jgi:hypothetical protein
MKRNAAVIAVLAIVLLGAIQAEPSKPLGVSVTINPSSQEPFQLLRRRVPPDSYIARVFVYDAADKSVQHAGGEVIVSAGQRQATTNTVEGTTVTFTVAVSKDNTRAMTEVVAKRGDKIVLHQQSDVVLRVPERAAVPLR